MFGTLPLETFKRFSTWLHMVISLEVSWYKKSAIFSVGISISNDHPKHVYPPHRYGLVEIGIRVYGNGSHGYKNSLRLIARFNENSESNFLFFSFIIRHTTLTLSRNFYWNLRAWHTFHAKENKHPKSQYDAQLHILNCNFQVVDLYAMISNNLHRWLISGWDRNNSTFRLERRVLLFLPAPYELQKFRYIDFGTTRWKRYAEWVSKPSKIDKIFKRYKLISSIPVQIWTDAEILTDAEIHFIEILAAVQISASVQILTAWNP